MSILFPLFFGSTRKAKGQAMAAEATKEKKAENAYLDPVPDLIPEKATEPLHTNPAPQISPPEPSPEPLITQDKLAYYWKVFPNTKGKTLSQVISSHPYLSGTPLSTSLPA